MKKMFSLCLATVLAVSMAAGSAVQAFAASPNAMDAAPAAVTEENCISGSWKRAEDPELTDQVRAMFDKAFAGLEGVSYTPYALLATRTTAAGRQYRVLCKATGVYPGAEEVYVVVILQRSWLGRAEIVEIGDAIDRTDLDDEEGAVGAYQQPDSPAMTEEASAALNKALEGLVGVQYVPVALLSEQVVAGTNYRILCEATVVYPGEQMHYVVVTLYESLEGNVSVLNVSDSYVN